MGPRVRFARSVLLLVCLAVLLSAASCSKPDPRAQFCDYVAGSIGDHVELPSGARIPSYMLNLHVETAASAPRVVLNSYTKLDDSYVLHPEAAESDMRRLGDLVGEFAAHSGWSEEYHLYIELVNGLDWSLTYDYETQMLYLPLRYDLLQGMAALFGSADFEEIASTEQGRQFLNQRGLAEFKDGEFKRRSSWTLGFGAAKTVSVVNGEFKSYGS
jgi:hypothetical protein